MAKRTGKSSSRGRGKRKRKTTTFISGAKSLISAVVLVGTGILIGSFWFEWRNADLEGSARDPAEVAAPIFPPKVEILNGMGEPGVADEVARALIDDGFDVVTVDNAEHFEFDETRVVARSRRSDAIGQVARRVGVDSTFSELVPELSLDATIILGKDWRSRFPEAADR